VSFDDAMDDGYVCPRHVVHRDVPRAQWCVGRECEEEQVSPVECWLHRSASHSNTHTQVQLRLETSFPRTHLRTTTMGDSVFVMIPSDFQTMSALATTFAKLSACSRNCEGYPSISERDSAEEKHRTCRTPRRRKVAISFENMVDGQVKTNLRIFLSLSSRLLRIFLSSSSRSSLPLSHAIRTARHRATRCGKVDILPWTASGWHI
jgi:hypothetical protein